MLQAEYGHKLERSSHSVGTFFESFKDVGKSQIRKMGPLHAYNNHVCNTLGLTPGRRYECTEDQDIRCSDLTQLDGTSRDARVRIRSLRARALQPRWTERRKLRELDGTTQAKSMREKKAVPHAPRVPQTNSPRGDGCNSWLGPPIS